MVDRSTAEGLHYSWIPAWTDTIIREPYGVVREARVRVHAGLLSLWTRAQR